jgi:hypothetical protein
MSRLISLFRFLRTPIRALGLILFGVGILYVVMPGLWQAYHNLTWTKVPGRIIESRWQNKLISQNGARPSFRLIPKIEYSYKVNDTEYKGTTIRLGFFDEFDTGLAKRKLEQYGTGRPVVIYHHPDNPGLSCLEQEKPSLTSILGLILGVVSFYAAFALLRQTGKTY